MIFSQSEENTEIHQKSICLGCYPSYYTFYGHSKLGKYDKTMHNDLDKSINREVELFFRQILEHMPVEHQEKAVLNQIKAEKIATDSLRSSVSA